MRDGCVATDNATAGWPERNRLRGSSRQQFRRPAIEPDRPQTRRTTERLFRVAVENDFARFGPARDQRVRSQIGEPLRFAAFGEHHVDFDAAFIPSAKSQPFAVARERRMTDRPQTRGEPSGDSAVGRNRPEIVVTDKHDRVVMNRWKSVVALCFHEVACELYESRFSLWKDKCSSAVCPTPATVRRSWRCRGGNCRGPSSRWGNASCRRAGRARPE